MKHHTLDAVMSMPQELFYPVGTVTCTLKPHGEVSIDLGTHIGP